MAMMFECNSPGTFPDAPPKAVPRPQNWFERTDIDDWAFDHDPPAFSAIPAIVGFIPFFEPAVGKPFIAEHPTYTSAVKQPFVQAVKDSQFIYPMKLSADCTEPLYPKNLDWIATGSLDDLRRIMFQILCSSDGRRFEESLINGVVPAILKRFRDSPRTVEEELSLLILSFDPIRIDYGSADEYRAEAIDILEKLPRCIDKAATNSMVTEVFNQWFCDDAPEAFYAQLSMEIWSWFQLTKKNPHSDQCQHGSGLESAQGNTKLSKQHLLTEQQVNELNRIFGLETKDPKNGKYRM